MAQNPSETDQLWKKTMILTVLFLGTRKGLSRPLSFYFLGHNGDFRAIHATTTSFADLSQWKRKPYSHMTKIEPGLGMHWQCFCPPFSWHVQLKIRKRNCGTLVTMRNSCLQLRRDLNPLPLHILKAGMHTTPDWNHCYNMFLLKRTAEVPGAKDMVSEAWTLASH